MQSHIWDRTVATIVKKNYFLFTSGSLSSIFLFPLSTSFFSLLFLCFVDVVRRWVCFVDECDLPMIVLHRWSWVVVWCALAILWVWVCGFEFMGLGLWVCIRGSSMWPGLRLGWWVLARFEIGVVGFGWIWERGGWVVTEVGCCGWGVGLGFDGFCLLWPPWVLGLWVLLAALSSLSSSHGEASLSQV